MIEGCRENIPQGGVVGQVVPQLLQILRKLLCCANVVCHQRLHQSRAGRIGGFRHVHSPDVVAGQLQKRRYTISQRLSTGKKTVCNAHAADAVPDPLRCDAVIKGRNGLKILLLQPQIPGHIVGMGMPDIVQQQKMAVKFRLQNGMDHTSPARMVIDERMADGIQTEGYEDADKDGDIDYLDAWSTVKNK